MTVLVRG